jgi:hypothetical protein
MTEHATLGHTDTVLLHDGDRSGAASSTAAFTDLVCADQELLQAEFTAIITANFPDTADGTQRRRPTRPVATRTPWAASPGAPAPSSHRSERGGNVGGRQPQARQRGPPSPTRPRGPHETSAGARPRDRVGTTRRRLIDRYDARHEHPRPARRAITTAYWAIARAVPEHTRPRPFPGMPVTVSATPAPPRPMPRRARRGIAVPRGDRFS